jgi:uncharacterized Zn finger protein
LPPELRSEDAPRRAAREGPHFDVLLELALEEKRPDDVLRWFDGWREAQGRASPRWYGIGEYEARVADAVAEAHPDRAEALYRELIARQIARANPSAYEQALPFLRKLRNLLRRLGRDEGWRTYLAHLRETERRKRRLMEVLDRIETRPIVQG